MNFQKLSAIIIGGFLLGIFLGIINVQFSFWYFILLLIIAFILFSYKDIQYMFLSKDVKKIEKYLEKKKKEPYYDFVLKLANKDMKGAKTALENIEAKWKNKKKTAVFIANYYLYMKNFYKVKDELEYINQTEFRHYFLTAIAIHEKDQEAYEVNKKHLKKDWMIYSLEAEHAKKQKNHQLAEELQQKALESVKGLQYYILYKEYEKA